MSYKNSCIMHIILKCWRGMTIRPSQGRTVSFLIFAVHVMSYRNILVMRTADVACRLFLIADMACELAPIADVAGYTMSAGADRVFPKLRCDHDV